MSSGAFVSGSTLFESASIATTPSTVFPPLVRMDAYYGQRVVEEKKPMMTRTFETLHRIVAILGAGLFALGCASSVPGESGATHFSTCRTAKDCAKLGSGYGCVAQVCAPNTDGTLAASDASGGSPTVLASSPGTQGDAPIAVDATSVYWLRVSNDGTAAVMKAPLGGGTPTTLASGQSMVNVGGIAVDGTTSIGRRSCRS